MDQLYANLSASITELKRNPTALIKQADGSAVAILNHNKPAAYLVPAEHYQIMLSMLEDAELLKLAKQRLKEKSNAIQVDINGI